MAAVLQQDVMDAVYSHEGPHVLWAVEVDLLQFCRWRDREKDQEDGQRQRERQIERDYMEK